PYDYTIFTHGWCWHSQPSLCHGTYGIVGEVEKWKEETQVEGKVENSRQTTILKEKLKQLRTMAKEELCEPEPPAMEEKR
ncbi:hypothetical protein HN51_063127, partial [Arachis hypogaea]